MSKPLLKKEIAAQAGISPRTLRRHMARDYSFLDRCRLRRSGRPVFDSVRVQSEMRKRKMV
jgi:hypothetical protein